jgi:tetratricopeptide (TPR) repeat protein
MDEEFALSSLRKMKHVQQPGPAKSIFLVLLASSLLLLPSVCFAQSLTEAKTYFRTGEYAKCIDAAKKQIENGSLPEDWRIFKIESELALGRYKDALASIEEAKTTYPFSIRVLWLEREVRRYNGESPKAKEILAEMASNIERANWRYRDAENMVIVGQFFLELGADAKQVRVDIFKQVQTQSPNFPSSFITAAELALAKNDYALAAEDFQKALKLDDENPRVLYGLARSFESSDPKKAEEYVNQALKINPRHVPSLLLVAENHLAAERYDVTEEVLAKVLEVNPSEPNAWAIRSVVAHLDSDEKKEKEAREKALANWKDNPHVDYLIGKFLAQKYRFAEAAEAQKRALAFDPTFLPAKMELSNDLLRLGDEEQGWKLAEEVFEADNYNVVAHNLTTLRDHMQKFRTLKSDGFLVRMDAKEAEIYGPRVLEVLRDARKVLTEKYQVELPETVAVEIFPKQQDFAIRTFGLPGGAGFLGVCFGNVITMNSPASQGSTPSNWEAVLWHEFCHVITLTKTRNKMPRWLSEGISVYEERLKNKSWGQSISPVYRAMILGDDLTPVSKLSGAFMQPPSGEHLMFAYYESSIVVEYIVNEYGHEALLAILDDLGKGLKINDAIARHAAPLEKVDAGFEKSIRNLANNFAKGAEFTDAESLPKRRESAALKAWLTDHPNSFTGLQQYAMALIREKQWEAAKEPIDKLLQLVPEYAEEDSPFLMKAKVSRELGETDEELALLEKMASLNADAVDTYRRLAELHSERNDWQAAILNAQRILAVNPLIPEPYRILAAAGEKTGDRDAAISGLRTLSIMDPYDPADIHFRTARLMEQAGRRDEARKHALMALEEAPRYQAAHELLLAILEPPATSPSVEHPSRPNTPDPPALPEVIE